MKSVTSEEEVGLARVQITQVVPPDDLGCPRFEVEAEASGLRVRSFLTLVRDGGRSNVGLADFLNDLAADWRGWESVREWESLDQDFALEATHHQRFLRVVFVLPRDHHEDAWEARVPTDLEPGEALQQLARDVDRFWERS